MSTPTIEEIREAYREIAEVMKNITTAEKCREIEKQFNFTIEINGFFIEEYVNQFENEDFANAAIEWIRVEHYKMLSYVYFHKNGSVLFDVWSEDVEDDFLVDITIDSLDAAYSDGLKWLEEKVALHIYEKFDSVGSENTDY